MAVGLSNFALSNYYHIMKKYLLGLTVSLAMATNAAVPYYQWSSLISTTAGSDMATDAKVLSDGNLPFWADMVLEQMGMWYSHIVVRKLSQAHHIPPLPPSSIPIS